MPLFRKALVGIALTVAGSLPNPAAAAMPTGAVAFSGNASIVQDVRYVCDNFGCYDRPDYGRPPPPPPGFRPPPPPGFGGPPPPPPPPGYRGPPPPPGFRGPPPPPPPGFGGPPPPRNGWGAHVRWCLNNHRSYDPDSNRYIDRDGRYRICRSPFR
jgi:hypothetical protein